LYPVVVEQDLLQLQTLVVVVVEQVVFVLFVHYVHQAQFLQLSVEVEQQLLILVD
tara:strand:- start:358 stop:522 length:165 start_codon:yes stop_codon:yes gene_type:complete